MCGGVGGGEVSFLVLPGLCERLSRGAQAGTKRAQCWQVYMLDSKSGAAGREVSPTLEGSLKGSDPTWLPAVQRLGSWYLEERRTGLSPAFGLRTWDCSASCASVFLRCEVCVLVTVSIAGIKHQDQTPWRGVF